MQTEPQTLKKKSVWKRILVIAIITFFSITLLISVGNITYTLINQYQSEQTFSELASMIVTEPKPEKDPEKEEIVEQPTLTPAEKYEVIAAKNKYFIGWIRIPDTVINYPVMHTPNDEERYLHRDFYDRYSFAGTPFVQSDCKVGESDNTIIYAHNMLNGTMFSDLSKFRNQSFVDKHPYIYLDTMQEYGQYEVMAVIHTQAISKSDFAFWTFVDAETEKDYDDFIAKAKQKSVVKTNLEAQYGDKLITLSTCWDTEANGRLVVIAKKCDTKVS